jgi:hypothetical protein
MSEHQDPRIQATDEQTTLAQRQQFWIDMSRTDFEQMCSEQQLFSSDAQAERNGCYDEALVFYTRLHNPEIWPNHILKGYLDPLEELRDAQIVVSADKFLKGRELGLVPDVPQGQSYLADFLRFTRNYRDESWQGFNELVPAVSEFRIALDSVLEEDEAAFSHKLSVASTALSDLRGSFDKSEQGAAVAEYISNACQALQVRLMHMDIGGDDQLSGRREKILENIGKHLQPLAKSFRGSDTFVGSGRPSTTSASLTTSRSSAPAAPEAPEA